MIEETPPTVPSKALARYIAERSLEPDTLYPFEELEHALDLTWKQLKSCIRWTNRILEKQHGRTIVWVRTEGLRVLHPKEFRSPVRTRLTRAANQVESAGHTLRYSDVSLMSSQDRAERDQLQSSVLALERMTTQNKRSVDGLETAV